MDKLKKCMTIMAIAGTVLVTGVFCYMPVREMIKEAKKNTVSLEQEATLGNSETPAEELRENMTQMSQNIDGSEAQNIANAEEINNKMAEIPTDNAVLHGAVLFTLQQEDEVLSVNLWQSNEDICYVFLPGFARDLPLQVEEVADGGSLTIGDQSLKEGDVLTDIVQEEAYACTLLDKEGTEIASVPLIFMYSSDLPVLSITTQSGSMEEIEATKGYAEAGALSLLDAQGKVLYEGAVTEIAGRGNSTYGLLKKPFDFELEKSADLFGFGKSKDYNLLADGYDETKLRNQLALGLAKALGMEYVPQGQSVELYCNGEYYGVYYLCEKVQVAEERLDITDPDEYTTEAYSSAELKQLMSIESEDGMRKWTDCEIEEADITGGYLLERELPERYGEEKSGFITKQEDYYLLKTPKYATENQVNYIADYMQEFQDAVQASDGVNKETGKHYSEYIDVDSFVGKYLTEEISRNYDGGVTSSYFYKKPDGEGGKLYAGPVWDFDIAFGNCTLDLISSNPVGITKLNDHIHGTSLFADLYEQEDFYAKVIEVYEQKAVPYLMSLLDGEIDKLAMQMAPAVKMDSIRWESLQNRHQYYETYENNVRQLKCFVEERMNFLNEVWLEGEVYHSVSFMVDGCLWKEYYYKDGQSLGTAPCPSRYNSLFMGWLTEAYDIPYDEFKPVYEDMIFYATWQQLPEVEVVITDGSQEGN